MSDAATTSAVVDEAGTAPALEPVAVSIATAADSAGIGRTLFYELLKADAGPRTFYINKRRLVLVEDLREWLRKRAAAGRGQ